MKYAIIIVSLVLVSCGSDDSPLGWGTSMKGDDDRWGDDYAAPVIGQTAVVKLSPTHYRAPPTDSELAKHQTEAVLISITASLKLETETEPRATLEDQMRLVGSNGQETLVSQFNCEKTPFFATFTPEDRKKRVVFQLKQNGNLRCQCSFSLNEGFMKETLHEVDCPGCRLQFQMQTHITGPQ